MFKLNIKNFKVLITGRKRLFLFYGLINFLITNSILHLLLFLSPIVLATIVSQFTNLVIGFYLYGKKVFKKCTACHVVAKGGKNKIGPVLYGVLGRQSAAISDYKYSNGLLSIEKKWSLINLYYFLEKPKEWAPGTKMSYRGISDSQKLLNTVKYLRENSISNEN